LASRTAPSWLPLFPTDDVRYNTIGSDDASCIMGREGRGKLAAIMQVDCST